MDFARRVRAGRVVKGLAGFAAAVLLVGGVALAAPAAERLKIDSATWRADRAELKVEGVSRQVDAVILVRDAATRKLLGSAAVRKDGKWMLKVRDPAAVPARMRAELEGHCVECPVQSSGAELAAVALPAVE